MLWKHERPEFRSVREMGHTHHAHTYIHHTHSIADFYGPPTWRRYDVIVSLSFDDLGRRRRRDNAISST